MTALAGERECAGLFLGWHQWSSDGAMRSNIGNHSCLPLEMKPCFFAGHALVPCTDSRLPAPESVATGTSPGHPTSVPGVPKPPGPYPTSLPSRELLRWGQSRGSPQEPSSASALWPCALEHRNLSQSMWVPIPALQTLWHRWCSKLSGPPFFLVCERRR